MLILKMQYDNGDTRIMRTQDVLIGIGVVRYVPRKSKDWIEQPLHGHVEVFMASTGKCLFAGNVPSRRSR